MKKQVIVCDNCGAYVYVEEGDIKPSLLILRNYRSTFHADLCASCALQTEDKFGLRLVPKRKTDG